MPDSIPRRGWSRAWRPSCASGRSAVLSAVFAMALGCGTPLVGQTVSGSVVEPDGSPVGDATVTLRTADGEVVSTSPSGPDGGFSLAIPEHGEYRIHADVPGYLPTVSLLFELGVERDYQIEVEMTPASPGSRPSEVPVERYREWVERYVQGWQKREIIIVGEKDWRAVSAGRELEDALQQLDFPIDRWDRRPDRPELPCPRTAATTRCLSVSQVSGDRGLRLRDISVNDVDAVVFVGHYIESGPSRGEAWQRERIAPGSIHLFIRGYWVGR